MTDKPKSPKVKSGERRDFVKKLGTGTAGILAAGTAWLYPVQTGDKPIISLFPTGIITYEFMMLCAMLGTMLGMFLEMGLPDLKRRASIDEAIAIGRRAVEGFQRTRGVDAQVTADAMEILAGSLRLAPLPGWNAFRLGQAPQTATRDPGPGLEPEQLRVIGEAAVDPGVAGLHV